MTQLIINDHDEKKGDRRKAFRFERSINLGTLLSIGSLIITSLIVYKGIVSKLDYIERAALRANVMWEYFIRDHPNIPIEELEKLR